MTEKVSWRWGWLAMFVVCLLLLWAYFGCTAVFQLGGKYYEGSQTKAVDPLLEVKHELGEQTDIESPDRLDSSTDGQDGGRVEDAHRNLPVGARPGLPDVPVQSRD